MIKLFSFILALLIISSFENGCVKLPTEPTEVDSQPLLVTGLGFQVKVRRSYLETGGTVTSIHGELADRLWRELMNALRLAGFPEKADPNNIRGPVSIVLHQFQQREFDCDKIYNPSGELVGAYYSPLRREVHVPGNYPISICQPLKHEYIHHWCYRALSADCIKADEPDQEKNHIWFMPNGQNIWELQ